MKLKLFFLLLFSLSAFFGVSAQNLHKVFEFAGELENSGQYEKAVLTYERVIFFDKKGLFRERVYSHIATCYFAAKDYDKAIEYYDLSYFSERNDSIRKELIFKKTAILILSEKFQPAIAELYNLPDSMSHSQDQRKNFYLGLASYGLNQFKDAEAYFIACMDRSGLEKETLLTLFKKVNKAGRINPRLSKFASMILPGSGQIYSGDLKNGLNSIFLLSAISLLALNTGVAYGFIDAAITVMPWFQRYYMGGYIRAEQIAVVRKNQKLEQLRSEILKIVASTKSQD